MGILTAHDSYPFEERVVTFGHRISKLRTRKTNEQPLCTPPATNTAALANHSAGQPSKWYAGAVVMKNWDPFVFGPA